MIAGMAACWFHSPISNQTSALRRLRGSWVRFSEMGAFWAELVRTTNELTAAVALHRPAGRRAAVVSVVGDADGRH